MPFRLENTPEEYGRRGGRPPSREPITPEAARARARWLVSDDRLSPASLQIIDALTCAGVLTANQLQRLIPEGASIRTLRAHQRRHLLDSFRVAPRRLIELGLATTTADSRAYTLGAVGLEVARLRSSSRLVTGYANFTPNRTIHDLMAAEIVIRLFAPLRNTGANITWYNKHEATVWEGKEPFLEPDSLVVLEGNGRHACYAIEYHGEDSGRRARRKVIRYEQIRYEGRWQGVWGTPLPVVLAMCRHEAVRTGYREAIRATAAQMTYYVTLWPSFLKRPESWTRLPHETNEDPLGAFRDLAA